MEIIIITVIIFVLISLASGNKKPSYHEALYKLADNRNALLYQGLIDKKFPVLMSCRNRGADIEEIDQTQHTPLMKAIGFSYTFSKEYKNVVEHLIEYGANVNPMTPLGITPLMVASTPRTQVFAVNQAQGMPIAICDRFTYELCAEILNSLLKKGANVNAQNNTGNTALHVAAAEGNAVAIKILVDAGADVTIKNELGETALDIFKEIQKDLKDNDLGPCKKFYPSDYDEICKLLKEKNRIKKKNLNKTGNKNNKISK